MGWKGRARTAGCALVLAGCVEDSVGVGPQASASATDTGTESSTGTTRSSGAETSRGSDDSDVSTTSASTTSTTTAGGETSMGDGSTTDAPMRGLDCAEILADDPTAQSGVHEIDPSGVGAEIVEVYCDMETDGGGWTRFWWWSPGTWPDDVVDVLHSPFGTCAADAPYCFGRLPPRDEATTSLLAIDPLMSTKYRWDFDPNNTTAHAAWLAFAEHMMIEDGVARDGDAWMPMALDKSTPPDATQDSFMYRVEHGVASVLMDDDNCDCLTTLQMGHGMCYGGWGTGSSTEFSYGVDRLYEPGPESGPRPDFHLELYFR